MTIRIVIADDHHVVRRGLAFFLKTQDDFEIIGEASNGVEAVKLAVDLKPDITLMDLDMPVMDGISATAKIREQDPTSKVMILTSFSDQDHVLPAIEAGAAGYQLKDVQPDELAASIRKLVSGEAQIHPKATTHLLTSIKSGRQVDELTRREKEVLQEIASGKSNKEISSALFITEKTVKTHVSNILGKLGLADRTQAALYAVKNGLAK
ncbi:DNA-binding response regulator [Bacillus sp. FJAT-27225]|uniref:response regulator n=1 Tax=Bacillus sp. FJAT-27225 TaxID=1743144 RepID=UPI00080C25FF|nr:response regulator transcription factor [Bacillus sp. FJAT-27225]OCA84417.1 DNA-binding response regulator [Bacillus sp. FJAT-27225]